MGEVKYTSRVQLERKNGPLRLARIPAESEPVWFGVHGGIAEHYGVDPSKLDAVHATTIDYVVAATGG